MSIQRLIFFGLSALFFIGSSMWIKDEFSPGWIKYQKEYYKEQAIKVEKEYAAAYSVKEKELLGDGKIITGNLISLLPALM